MLLNVALRNRVKKELPQEVVGQLVWKSNNITVNGVKMGASGFVTYKDSTVYFNTEGIQYTGENRQVMYRRAKDNKDYSGFGNQWTTEEKIGEGIARMLLGGVSK